jgi:hypothetical protein
MKNKKEANNKIETPERKTEKQLVVVFAVLIIVIAFFVGIMIWMQSSNNFTYKGIKFEKSYSGKIAFYTATVPIMDNYGNINEYISIDFRNNPNKLKGIEVDTFGGIRFFTKNKTYVSYDNFGVCENNGLAAANLGIFLHNAGIDYNTGMNDPFYKNSTNIIYVNCETNPDNTVIRVINSTENKILRTSQNCYEIHFTDCKILEATEKFELTILEQYINDTFQ